MAQSHPLGMHCSLAFYCGSIRPYAEGNSGEAGQRESGVGGGRREEGRTERRRGGSREGRNRGRRELRRREKSQGVEGRG